MKRLETLPNLPPPTPYFIVGLLLTFWLAMRIRILRRRQARRGPEAESPAAWAWLRALAAKPWILPALAGLAAVWAAAIALSFAWRF